MGRGWLAGDECGCSWQLAKIEVGAWGGRLVGVAVRNPLGWGGGSLLQVEAHAVCSRHGSLACNPGVDVGRGATTYLHPSTPLHSTPPAPPTHSTPPLRSAPLLSTPPPTPLHSTPLHWHPFPSIAQVLGSNYQEELLRLIAPEHLMQQYGGACTEPLT